MAHHKARVMSKRWLRGCDVHDKKVRVRQRNNSSGGYCGSRKVLPQKFDEMIVEDIYARKYNSGLGKKCLCQYKMYSFQN